MSAVEQMETSLAALRRMAAELRASVPDRPDVYGEASDD